MIADLTFAAGFLALCAGLGLPIIAALPPGRWPAAALAAPPLGLALLAIAVTALYRHGVAPATTLAVAAPCAAAGLALGARRAWRAGRAARACAGGAVLAAAVVALACLAPRWTGGPAFAVFQGNHFDQLNYLAYAAAFRRFGYDEIRGLGDAAFVTNASLHYIAHHLDGRPAAMAVYAALAEAAGRGTAAASHAYVATLQALMFFAAAFALVAVFRVGPARAFVAAAAIAVGFPMQYVVDINAWSQLAAMPLALAALAMLAILLERPTGGAPPERRTARLASVAACGVLAGGLMYLYPEIAAAYGPAAAACVAAAAARGRSPAARRRAATDAGAAAATGLVACIPYPAGTIGALWPQLGFALGPDPGWWRYFQRFLLGDDLDRVAAAAAAPWSPGSLIDLALTVPVDLSAGAAGLYFALPPAGIAAPARVAWQIALAAFLAALIAAGARAAARSWRDPCDGRPRLFLAAALAAIAMPAVVGAAGRWWPAGKLLAMVAPLIVLVLALPALLPPTRAPGARLPAWLLIASGLALGVVRPIAAADPSGIAYRPPYPSAQDPRLKADYDWDLERHRAALRRCRAIVLDVADPFLDWYAQIFLDELGRPWSSARPVAEYYGAGRVLGRPPPVADPDCLVTTVLRPAEPGRRVFWLARDRQLEDFVRGTRPSIALAPATPIGVETSGLHDGDGRIRWTDGSATFRLPIDPRAPVRHVALSLWPIGLAPPRTLTVRINGAVLHAGAIADALALEWTLGDLGAAPMLEIALSSDTFRAEGDSRALGLALRALVVSH